MPSRPVVPPVTRRGLLALGSATLVAPSLVGCAATTAQDGGPGGPGAPAAPSLSPDVALATLALAELRAAERAVIVTLRDFPGLRDGLRGLLAMHRAHESALVDAVPEGAEPGTEPAPYAVPARRPAALARLREREREVQARLADLAVDARSGAFAALLAAMSAGTAQRVARWPS